MVKFILLNLILILSSMLMLIKTPLNLGLLILIQTLMFCLIMNINMSIYWISYILYLIMLGGILILFVYMCSISSNEIIKFNINWIMLFFSIYTLSYMYMNNKNFLWLNFFNLNLNSLNFIINKEIIINISKIYNNYIMMITLMLITYLLITLMMVSMFVNMNYGPLRSSK
nr:NADH dehydrogenase subunit 6 [Cheumatopsyche sp. XG-2022]